MSEIDPLGEIATAWRSDRSPFSAWVRGVSQTVDNSRLKTVYVAHNLGTTVATLDGVLQLSLLDDASLALLDEAIPQTAYLQLARCSTDEIEKIVAVLGTPDDDGLAPSERVALILRETRGAPIHERVGELPSEVFIHFAKKSEDYDILNKNERKALGDFGRWRKNGKLLTIKQANWAIKMLTELRDRGAIRRDSPDSDQAVCDQVLDVIGG